MVIYSRNIPGFFLEPFSVLHSPAWQRHDQHSLYHVIIKGSILHVRISVFSASRSVVEVVNFNATRAFEKPDVPPLINSIKVVVNIDLDLLIISNFHVGKWTADINSKLVSA